MKILVGNTGLIGQNLKEKINFDYEFNSKNIEDINLCFDNCDLYLCCLPATKWYVNQNIQEDFININSIVSHLLKKRYKNIFLFSTIDVYSDSPLKVNEDYFPNFSGLNYGSNRLLFEHLIKQFTSYENFYIFRLPALFGKFLKKNVIYDLLNNNRIDNINLNSYYQWYNLESLKEDIERLISQNSQSNTFNLFTEPIYTEELISTVFPEFKLKTKGDLITYDWTTKHSSFGYMSNKNVILNQIEKFVYEIRNQ
jgi:hypothetical protein